MAEHSLTEPFSPSTPPSEDDTARRAAYVEGLRQLAAFVEAHPELPIPWAGPHNAFAHSKDELAAFARTGVRWTKAAIGNHFFLSVPFAGGHSYDINIQREQVCRKVVTGTRIEPAQPAQPEREVETYEWICDESLLAGVQR